MASSSFPIFIIIAFLQLQAYNLQAQTNDVITAITAARYSVESIEDLERDIVSHNNALPKNTPAYKQYLNSYPMKQLNKPETFSNAIVAAMVSKYLGDLYCSDYHSDEQKCAERIALLELQDDTLAESCTKQYHATCVLNAKYRSISGACNNLLRPTIGKATTAYGRALPSRYFDGISQMRPAPVLTKKSVPHPRVVSVKLSQDDNHEETNITLAAMQWAQFVANDLAYTPVQSMARSDEAINCCKYNGKYLPVKYIHPACAPIIIQLDDPIYKHSGIECLNYVRSLPALKSNCTFGSVDQVNQVSHYLDASTIYGSTEERSTLLREMVGGLLRVNIKNGREYLPDSNAEYASECEGTCYAAGDDRVNEHPQLAALHTIWLREHNRIARGLQGLHDDWTDDQLFEEARRRVIAEIQHITYREWMPIQLGEEASNLTDHSGKYRSYISAAVDNEVATAALRYLYSLMQQDIKLPDESRQVRNIIRLADHYYKPRAIESGDTLDGLLRGLTTQLSKKFDINLVSDLTSKLYTSDGNLGLDLLSFDIQRGRDHGLAGYMEYRRACELDTGNFEELVNKGIMAEEVVNKLKRLYPRAEEIDLIIGGLAEIPKMHDGISDTFRCLLLKQFYKTRYGDRYFYDNPNQPYAFTTEQLNELQQVTLARIICDNADNILSIQPNVFLSPGESNEIVPCSRIASPNVFI